MLNILKLLALLALIHTVTGEQCDKDFEFCNEGMDEESHNVWKEADMEEHETDPIGLITEDFNELEMEIFVQFFSNLRDWTPTSESLANYRPEDLFAAIMRLFHSIDTNDDGNLDKEEVTKLLKKTQIDEAKINALLDYPNNKMSIFQYLKIFKKLGGGKQTVPLLTPFEKLEYMPPLAAKRIMLGSVEMFNDSDEDKNGKLDKDEFALGMQRSKEKRAPGFSAAEVTEEQSHLLFDMIDKDKDEYLTYSEFQATMPDQRKSFEQTIQDIFNEADLNSDMEISQDEFKYHMTDRARKMNAAAPPSDEQITMAFDKLDKDENGALNVAELHSLFDEVKQVQEKRMLEAFSNFDEDGDEFLSLDELHQIAEEMEKATGQKIDTKTLMNMLDSDKDGLVSLEEMQVTLTKMAEQPMN